MVLCEKKSQWRQYKVHKRIGYIYQDNVCGENVMEIKSLKNKMLEIAGWKVQTKTYVQCG